MVDTAKTLVEYVWLGSSGANLRSKTKVFDSAPTCVEDIPVISSEGSGSNGLAPEEEVFLKPRKMFAYPCRGDGALLVLCDTFSAQVPNADTQQDIFAGLKPVFHPSTDNTRAACERVLDEAGDECDASFAVEQEYLCGSSMAPFVPANGLIGIAFPGVHPATGLIPVPPAPPSPAASRRLAEHHLQACIQAGLKITDLSQRDGTGAWSYKLGPLPGLDAADQLWMSRYLLLRVSEEEGIPVSFQGQCNVEFSTAATRCSLTGLAAIQEHLKLLKASHLQHAIAYGRGFLHPTTPAECSVGTGSNTLKALTVPTITLLQQAGHYVDCRPAADADPYTVIMMMVATTQKVDIPMPTTTKVLQSTKRSRALIDPSADTGSAVVCDEAVPSNGVGPIKRARASWGDASSDTTSLNSEELLIDELNRIEGEYEGEEGLSHGGSDAEGWDECCSSGSSPERPLLLP